MDIEIFCVSDTHSKPLDNPPPGAVAVLHAGDFYEHDGEVAEISEPLANCVRQFTIPVLAVRGNHDIEDPLAFFDSDRDVTERLVQAAAGLWVAGVGWRGMTRSDLPGENDLHHVCGIVERQIWRLVRRVDRLILLSHYPPAIPSLGDILRHGPGYDCLRDLIDVFHPAAFIFGHVHESAGRQEEYVSSGHRTLVFNPGPTGGLLRIDQDGRASFTATTR